MAGLTFLEALGQTFAVGPLLPPEPVQNSTYSKNVFICSVSVLELLSEMLEIKVRQYAGLLIYSFLSYPPMLWNRCATDVTEAPGSLWCFDGRHLHFKKKATCQHNKL